MSAYDRFYTCPLLPPNIGVVGCHSRKIDRCLGRAARLGHFHFCDDVQTTSLTESDTVEFKSRFVRRFSKANHVFKSSFPPDANKPTRTQRAVVQSKLKGGEGDFFYTRGVHNEFTVRSKDFPQEPGQPPPSLPSSTGSRLAPHLCLLSHGIYQARHELLILQ
jgi:hypothetical protein